MPAPWISGVASGLSIHLGLPVAWVRALFVVASGYLGIGILLYILLAVFVPKDDKNITDQLTRGAPPLARVSGRSQSSISRTQIMMVGVGFLVFGGLVFYMLGSDGARSRWLISAVLVLAGLWMAWNQTNNVVQWRTLGFWGRVLGGMLLVIVGATIFLSQTNATGELLRGALYGAILMVAVLFMLAPLWLRAAGQLSQAQARQVRESERAHIAAHLHDSVLQTLTLIRGAADQPAKVRALALGQEAELRAWLYTGQADAGVSTAQSLRDQITQTESLYGVAVDVVTVGDVTPQANELALVAAAGEAAKNAVRHGIPPVSVYMETRHDQVEVYIKDRGVGFDMDAIPEDRHGVRGSIIGRIERVGGTANIRRLSPGTEVHLTVPRTDNAQS